MEDGIDSKKGRRQLQTEGEERETTLRFSPQIIAFYSDIGEKEHRNSGTPARRKHKKIVFLLGEHKKKRHLRAGDGAMLCECFANGLKISPRCDGGLAHRWRAP